MASERTRAAVAAASAATSAETAVAVLRQCMEMGEPARHPLLNHTIEGPEQAALRRFSPSPLLELRPHSVLSQLGSPLQFGLFARTVTYVEHGEARPVIFSAGDVICGYGGVLLHKGQLKPPSRVDVAVNSAVAAALPPRSHARRVPGSDYILDGLPFACMLRRPVPRCPAELTDIVTAGLEPLLPSSSLFSPQEILRYHLSPLGYMANTASGTQCNVHIGVKRVKLAPGATSLDFSVPVLVASRDIREGDEILSPYGLAANAHEQKLMIAAPQRPPPIFAHRAMLAGNPAHPDLLQRQLANLQAFVHEEFQAFAELQYMPWTTMPRASHRPRPIPVLQKASTLVVGSLGLFLCDPLTTGKQSVKHAAQHSHMTSEAALGSSAHSS